MTQKPLNPVEIFRHSYDVHSISSCGSMPSDAEVNISMGLYGFQRMIGDLIKPDEVAVSRNSDFPFEISKLATTDDALLVMKVDLSRYGLETARICYEHLRSQLPDKQIILIPNDINVETIGVENLTSYRDSLNSIIENLDYNHIMGF